MMQSAQALPQRPPAFSSDEAVALGIAVVAHVLLVAALAFGSLGKEPVAPPKRMTVTLADEIADRSTSPNPFDEAPPDDAPMLGEVPPEPVPAPMVSPQPAVQPKPLPMQVRQAPAPVARPQPPKPQPRQTQAPRPPQPAPKDTRDRRRPDAPAGGSRIGSDFLSGIPAGTRPGAQGNPAEAISDQAKASARQSIANEVLPFWNRCIVDGADIEKLSVRIVMHLDRSGRLVSMDRPEISGRTAANAAQVDRFTECAQSAIRSASPFSLPPASYEFWKDYPVRLRKQRVN